MYRNYGRCVRGVSQGDSLVEFDVVVTCAGQQGSNVSFLEDLRHCQRNLEVEFTFCEPRWSSRSGVFASMSRIKHYLDVSDRECFRHGFCVTARIND